MNDFEALERAIFLAEQVVGQTTPNPPVGAVCLKDGLCIGEGAHLRAGSPHAEVNALNSCTTSPHGATLYVTLEPCSTTGRTPPCCDLIRAKGIARVVIGCLDPNPKHAGRGVEILKAAGIHVDLAQGKQHERCKSLIAPFVKAITTQRAYVRLKLAMTLDGYIADRTYTSQWITGEKARQWVQNLRSKVDAIMVGSGTVREDHPSLQPHLPDAPQKVRVLIDRTTPIAVRDRDAQTLIATEDLGYDGANLTEPLRQLCQRGIQHVLCEGGGELGAALLEQGLVDELILIYAPKLLGDLNAVRGLPIAPRRLPEAMGFTVVERRNLGQDTALILKPHPFHA
jgi:diaminohydroxyphosphoribosylaminopyrimidine deaminase/5-amino-6-(5-phosphoribosylamino)uracil reductase